MKKLFVLFVVLAALAGCQPGPPALDYATGELRVEGSVTHADILYRVWGGTGANQVFNTPLPWAHTTGVVLSGDSFYLAAQSNDPTGNLTVTALVDGVTMVTQTITDPFGFVAIYGIAP